MQAQVLELFEQLTNEQKELVIRLMTYLLEKKNG